MGGAFFVHTQEGIGDVRHGALVVTVEVYHEGQGRPARWHTRAGGDGLRFLRRTLGIAQSAGREELFQSRSASRSLRCSRSQNFCPELILQQFPFGKPECVQGSALHPADRRTMLCHCPDHGLLTPARTNQDPFADLVQHPQSVLCGTHEHQTGIVVTEYSLAAHALAVIRLGLLPQPDHVRIRRSPLANEGIQRVHEVSRCLAQILPRFGKPDHVRVRIQCVVAGSEQGISKDPATEVGVGELSLLVTRHPLLDQDPPLTGPECSQARNARELLDEAGCADDQQQRCSEHLVYPAKPSANEVVVEAATLVSIGGHDEDREERRALPGACLHGLPQPGLDLQVGRRLRREGSFRSLSIPFRRSRQAAFLLRKLRPPHWPPRRLATDTTRSRSQLRGCLGGRATKSALQPGPRKAIGVRRHQHPPKSPGKPRRRQSHLCSRAARPVADIAARFPGPPLDQPSREVEAYPSEWPKEHALAARTYMHQASGQANRRPMRPQCAQCRLRVASGLLRQNACPTSMAQRTRARRGLRVNGLHTCSVASTEHYRRSSSHPRRLESSVGRWCHREGGTVNW
mmetsp:Transcript_147629/g.472274  ORF Transcript_147629/g.472274 Transcript_147629/m.472274 type:complete len:573 (+) Transcript_147629:292-2010(+)